MSGRGDDAAEPDGDLQKFRSRISCGTVPHYIVATRTTAPPACAGRSGELRKQAGTSTGYHAQPANPASEWQRRVAAGARCSTGRNADLGQGSDRWNTRRSYLDPTAATATPGKRHRHLTAVARLSRPPPRRMGLCKASPPGAGTIGGRDWSIGRAANPTPHSDLPHGTPTRGWRIADRPHACATRAWYGNAWLASLVESASREAGTAILRYPVNSGDGESRSRWANASGRTRPSCGARSAHWSWRRRRGNRLH